MVLPKEHLFASTKIPELVVDPVVLDGVGQLVANIDGIQDHWTWIYLRDPYWYCLLTFILNTAAYIAEIMRGGNCGPGADAGRPQGPLGCGREPYDGLRRHVQFSA